MSIISDEKYYIIGLDKEDLNVLSSGSTDKENLQKGQEKIRNQKSAKMFGKLRIFKGNEIKEYEKRGYYINFYILVH